MARRRLPPIKSEKEEITWSNIAQDASSTTVIPVATAVDTPTTAGQVEIGDIIKWVYIEFNVSAETITNTKIVHWGVIKNKAGGVYAFIPSAYDANFKSAILKRGMEMLVKDVGTVIKRIFVVKIPKGMQRMADGDTIEFRYIATSAETINCCGIAIQRHYG